MVETFTHFFQQLGGLLNPGNLVVLVAAVTMGIAFGALPLEPGKRHERAGTVKLVDRPDERSPR